MSTKLTILVVSLIAISLGLLVSNQMTQQNSPSTAIKGMIPVAVELKPFSLIDQNNNQVTAQQLKGQWSIVSIGYTSCPDICPATLQKYQQIRKILSDDSRYSLDTQFIFVSVDPERDTVERLKAYLEYFSPDFVGLTGDNKQLKLFTDSIYASFIIPDTSKENYAVGHSAALHILNDQGRLQAIMSPPYTVNEVVSNYTNIREYLAAKK
jgi:protein SCO1